MKKAEYKKLQPRVRKEGKKLFLMTMSRKESKGSDISKGGEDSLTIKTVTTPPADTPINMQPPADTPINMQPEKTELDNIFIILMGFVAYIFLSMSSVWFHKLFFKSYAFPNMSLFIWQLICTSVWMFFCRLCGMFTVKKVELAQMIRMALTFCGSVLFTTNTLQCSTVGTYQMLLSAPCIIIIQTYSYARHFSKGVMLTLVPVIVDVWITSYCEIKFNMTEIILASIGVYLSSLYLVFIFEKQKELDMNAMQLLYYQAPLSALCLGLMVPFLEPVFTEGGKFGWWSKEVIAPGFLVEKRKELAMYGVMIDMPPSNYQAPLSPLGLGLMVPFLDPVFTKGGKFGWWSKEAITPGGMVALSGTFSCVLTVCSWWIIGNTSPLTYYMFGKFKSSMVMLLGFINLGFVFGYPFQSDNTLDVLGITLTLLGVFAYTLLQLNNSPLRNYTPNKQKEKTGLL